MTEIKPVVKDDVKKASADTEEKVPNATRDKKIVTKKN